MTEPKPTNEPVLYGLTEDQIIEDYTVDLKKLLPENLSSLRGIPVNILLALIESAKSEGYTKGYLKGVETAKDIIAY